jgi:hypothetical protein
VKTLGEKATLERIGKIDAATQKTPVVWCIFTHQTTGVFVFVPWTFGSSLLIVLGNPLADDQNAIEQLPTAQQR